MIARRPSLTLSFALLLAALITLAYSNSFGIGFHFDDITGIAQNPSVTSLRNIPSYFRDPFTLTLTRENVDVRPVLQVTFAICDLVIGNRFAGGIAPGTMPWKNRLIGNPILSGLGRVLLPIDTATRNKASGAASNKPFRVSARLT